MSDPSDTILLQRQTTKEGDTMKTYFEILADWGITNPTEQDVWDAIKEANPDSEIYEDGDLAEWL